MIASQQQLMRRATDSSIEGNNENRATENEHVPLLVESPLKLDNGNGNGSGSGNGNEASNSFDNKKSESQKDKKRKSGSSWFNILNPTYKSRQAELKKFFNMIPSNERLICDYSCALQKDILIQGRIYLTVNYFAFYANIFKWETNVVIKCKDITSLTKTNTAFVIPNAIQICTKSDKFVFTSFVARDKTFVMMFRVWQNALLDQPMSTAEIWQWVRYSYGDDLGLSHDDDEEDFHNEEEDEYKDERCFKDEECFKDVSPKLNVESNDSQNSSETDSNEINEIQQVHDDIPCQCECSSHSGKLVIDSVFEIDVDQAFQLMFTDSLFIQQLLKLRRTHSVTISPWQETASNDKKRQLSYTLTLNHTLIKSASTTETQYLLSQTKPGSVYMINSEVINHGVPYSDSYVVNSQWCLTKESVSSSRLKVHVEVVYTKNSWSIGLIKSMLEKSAIEGISDYCNNLASHLVKWIKIEKRISEIPNNNGNDIVDDDLSIGQHKMNSSNRFHDFGDLKVFADNPSILHNKIKSDSLLLKLILVILMVILFFNIIIFIYLYRIDWSNQQIKSFIDENIPENFTNLKQFISKFIKYVKESENDFKSKYFKDEL